MKSSQSLILLVSLIFCSLAVMAMNINLKQDRSMSPTGVMEPASTSEQTTDENQRSQPEPENNISSCSYTLQNNEIQFGKQNEDRVIVNDLGMGSRSLIMGVFDGHGGSEIADWLSQGLPVQLRNNIRQMISTSSALEADLSSQNPRLSLESVVMLKQVIRTTVLELDRIICQKGRKAIGGAAASFTVIIGNYAFVVNIGDSRTLVLHNDELLHETSIHVPNDPKESRHIHMQGGQVVVDAQGTSRVNGIWAMSRAFGDCLWKVRGWREYSDFNDRCANYDGVNGVMRVDPEIKIILMADGNYTFVSGTDGVFDVYENFQVAMFVQDPERAAGPHPTICRDIVQAARHYQSTDDITVTFMKLMN